MAPSFGLVLPSSTGGGVPDPDSLWSVAEAADQSPLDHIWVSDHIVWWHPMYESLTLLAALAARTRRVRIGTAVLLLAMRNPVIAAKTLASIDRLSGGRLTVGVGIGGEFPPEWEAVGVPLRTRVSRTEEMIEALRGLWAEGSFGYEGNRIHFDPVDLHPKPLRSPPIWIGGRSEAAVRRAARLGDGWMGLFLTPKQFEQRAGLLRQAEREAGRSRLPLSLYLWTCIADSDQQALAVASDLLPSFYNVPFEKLARHVVVGSPATCAGRFQEFAAAGAEHIAVAPVAGASPELVVRLSEEVMPLVGD